MRLVKGLHCLVSVVFLLIVAVGVVGATEFSFNADPTLFTPLHCVDYEPSPIGRIPQPHDMTEPDIYDPVYHALHRRDLALLQVSLV
jgi:hypothetical protein